MQYLVSEVFVMDSQQTGKTKTCGTLSEVLSFLAKANKNQMLLIGKEDLDKDRLLALLKERLSSVSISIVGDPARTWIVTAF